MTVARSLLLLATASALALSTAAAASPWWEPQASEAPAGEAPSKPWAQSVSDVPADPEVRFGVLTNGMRYALLRNATPPGQASFRLRIDAGSLMENDDQLGLAHFMEHMVFNGTANVPESEMLKILERLGLAFGADANAATTFDQTFYMLDLPNTREETVAPVLNILREMMSEASMTEEAIEAERGVIVAEARTRNTPAFRSLSEQLKLIAPGRRLSERLPIGSLDVIRSAPRERFVDFYRSYYRPSRATFIAVGDFDVEELERRVHDAFGSWRPAGPDGPAPDLGEVQPLEPGARLLVEPGVQSSIQLNWISPPEAEGDSLARRRERVIRQLVLSVLNRRLAELSRQESPPFISAGAMKADLFDSLSMGTVTATFSPGQWRPALEALEREQRRLVEYGVTQQELEREITETRTRLEAAAASAATRPTPALAAALLNSANDDTVFVTPAFQFDLFNQTVENLTPDQVRAAVAELFEGQGPLVLMVSPEDIPGGGEALTATLAEARLSAVEPPKEAGGADWPYVDFGPEGRVVERKVFEDIGATRVTFANGVSLVVKPTGFKDEEVLVSVRAGAGELGLPTDRVSPVMLAPLALGPSGVGKMTLDELNRSLSGKVYSTAFAIEEDAFRLSGVTRERDLQTQMQVLAAYLTDPGARPAVFEQMKAVIAQFSAQLDASPVGVLQREVPALLASGDRREAFPTPAETAALGFEDYAAQLRQALSAGPVEIIVVGDAPLEAVVSSVASTFGALPKREAAAVLPGSAHRRFPSSPSQPVALNHGGPRDQALGYVAWPTTDARTDPARARALDLLAQVLQLRLTDEIRERQGLAYYPKASAAASEVYPGYGMITVSAETPPEALDELFGAVDAIAASLRDVPVSEDELTRARQPAVETLRRRQAGNDYWRTALARLSEDEGVARNIVDHASALEAVTAADLQTLAREYLRPDTAWRATVTARPAR